MGVTIIGVDCATKMNKVGLALGREVGGDAWIEEVALGSRVAPVAETIAGWASRSDCTLLAFDAPLGWPVDLGGALVAHTAGEPIDGPGMTCSGARPTGSSTAESQRPLEVGANWIARTAHAALELLGDVRKETKADIPLAWDPDISTGIQAIEVYPAATLKAYRVQAQRYKDKDKQAARRELLAFLGEQVRLPEDTKLMEDNADALDAGLCVLAAVDFLQGNAMKPGVHMPKAQKEGWIWVWERVK